MCPDSFLKFVEELSAEINLQDTITLLLEGSSTQLPSTFDPSTDIYKTDAHLYYNESEIDSFKVGINVMGTQVAVESTPSVKRIPMQNDKTLCEKFRLLQIKVILWVIGKQKQLK